MTDHSRLQQLIDLAKEPSSEKRRDLLRGITDIFLEDPDGFNAREKDHFADIMGKVAQEMERKVREDLAHRLAEVAEAPKSLLIKLAKDEIEVARPILEKSAGLSDEDLLAIVRQGRAEHQRSVAARETVSAELSDALVERGDDSVLKTLVANKGATISRPTMERVVQRAEGNQALHAPLLDRADLPPDLMQDMFWFVSSQLRKRILSITSEIDPKVVDQLLAESEKKLASSLGASSRTKTKAQQFIDEKAAKRELNEALLVQLLREKRVPELVCGFAKLVQVDESTARRIIFDKTGEGLAIACKATRFDRSTFSTFVLLAGAEGSRSMEDARVLLELYDKVPVDIAQRTMRFWRVRRETMAAEAA